jgi:hypothetical protein
MDQVLAALDSAWRVLLIGVLMGAGMPVLFALGVKALAWGAGGEAEAHLEGESPRPHVLGRLLALVLFTLVVLVVLGGVGYIVAHGLGWVITFDGIVPVFSHK